jgi:hypothetical protein
MIFLITKLSFASRRTKEFIKIALFGIIRATLLKFAKALFADMAFFRTLWVSI